jgi:hypothetical protein
VRIRRSLAVAVVLLTVASGVSAGSLFRRLRSTDPSAVQAVAAQQHALVSVPEPSTLVLAVVDLASLVALAGSRQF